MVSVPTLIKDPSRHYLGRRVWYFSSIHSTNLELLEDRSGRYQSGDIAWASRQSSGLGRYRRHWVSDYGGLYFSILFEDVKQLDQFYPFVILCALAAAEELQSQLPTPSDSETAPGIEAGSPRPSSVSGPGSGVRIKWPNDIYLDGKKICGILVQSRSSAALSRLVIGIGMNLNNSLPETRELRQAATSLSLETGVPVDIDSFRDTLFLRIDKMYHEFIQGRFSDHLHRLNALLYAKGEAAEFSTGSEQQRIVPIAFDSLGRLQAELQGQIRSFSYGECL